MPTPKPEISREWQAGYAAAMRDCIEMIKRRMPLGLPREALFDDLLAIGIGRAP